MQNIETRLEKKSNMYNCMKHKFLVGFSSINCKYKKFLIVHNIDR